MSDSNSDETAYAFHLDATKDGWRYFRTVSLFSGYFASHGRDQRQAHPVISHNFERIIAHLEQRILWVRNADDLNQWVSEFGWGLVPHKFAQGKLARLLSSHPCVKSAIGLYWDESLPRDFAAQRKPSKEVRRRVLERDRCRCIECGKEGTKKKPLTMDHVIPFSRGGETTADNLVTLCRRCNQRHGNSEHSHLFLLAGLHHGWDPALLTAKLIHDPVAIEYAMKLSHNMMVSRCPDSTLTEEQHSQ